MKYIGKSSLIWMIILVFVFGCASKNESIGNLDEIIVFADSTDWPDYQEPLNSVFGKVYKTPRLEREYVLSWQSPKLLGGYKKSKNIFFLGWMDSNQPVSTLVRNSLSKDIIDNVNSSKYFYIPKNDAWAFDQYVLFLLAPNKNELINRIQKYGDTIYEDFEKSYYRRYKEEIYKNYENKKLEEYLLNHFPFKIRIPSDFFIANESLENNFVWIRRIDPDRSLLVHWVSFNDSMDYNYDWIVKERNKIAKITYEGDVVVEEETEVKTVQFLQWQALRLEGTWKNEKYLVGGPFRDITFYDEESNLMFMVDFYVRAIGERKKMYLDMLDIMAHTFQSKAYLESN